MVPNVSNQSEAYVYVSKLPDPTNIIALTGDKHFESLYNEGNLKNKKGGVTMCDIVQGFVDEGKAEGKAELIKKMLDANFVTPEQIANLLKISVA